MSTVNSMKKNTSYVGTFHKTGTVLLGGIFADLNAQQKLQLWRSDHHPLAEPETWDINFHYDSKFIQSGHYAELPPDARIVISVRDPRDLLISGARYHQDSKEEWLHKPQERFDGKTYQEAINALETQDDRLLFELKYSSGGVVKRMQQVPWGDPRIMRVKLEDLMVDKELRLFEDLFRYLGMRGDLLSAALEQAKARSLFSKPKQSHSRGGVSGEWKSRLSPRVQEAFNDAFPDAVKLLGYPMGA